MAALQRMAQPRFEYMVEEEFSRLLRLSEAR